MSRSAANAAIAGTTAASPPKNAVNPLTGRTYCTVYRCGRGSVSAL
jgi:hypothetical protein